MPSKKSHNRGKKLVQKTDAVNKQQDITPQKNVVQEKQGLKYSNWTEDDNSVEVTLFAGSKLKSDDLDVIYREQSCDVKLIDGRECHLHFFRPIDTESCRVQLKGLRIYLKVRKLSPGKWPQLEYVPGLSDETTPKQKEHLPVESKCNKPEIAKKKTVTQTPKNESSQQGEDNSKVVEQSKQPENDYTNENVEQEAGECGIKEERRPASTFPENMNHGNSNVTERSAAVITALKEEAKPDVTDLLAAEATETMAIEATETEVVAMEDRQKKDCTQQNIYNLMHVKNDFFEKTVAKPNDTVSVQVYVKEIVKESVQVIFEGQNVSVTFQTRNLTFLNMYAGTDENTVFGWNIQVVDDLLESQCRYKLKKTSLELTLRKKVARRWCALEAVHTKGKILPTNEWQSAVSCENKAKVEAAKHYPKDAAKVDAPTSSSTKKSTLIFDEMEVASSQKPSKKETSKKKKVPTATLR